MCPPSSCVPRWRIRRRPNSLPPYWRAVLHFGPTDGYTRFRDQMLVLSARNIPHKIISWAGRKTVYAPPLHARMANTELREFLAETPEKAPPRVPACAYSYLTTLALVPLILWHGWRGGWWNAPPFLPPPETWAAAGVLDTVKVRIFDQWYRLVTATTLHADDSHLWGNVAFGALFLTLLARLTGAGKALWLSLAGGVLANAASVFLRDAPARSMGFSTVLFASVGIMAGIMACRETQRRRAILPVAGAAGILALLGTEGANTDYMGHLAGFFCGLALGIFEAWHGPKNQGRGGQILAAFCALLLPVSAWLWAFARG